MEPLLHHGNVDTKVQAYIKAWRKAGTPVNMNIVLAAAEGVVTAVDGTLLKKNGGTIDVRGYNHRCGE